MRSSRHTAHGRLARWFYALLNARHGVLLGAPLAAALIMMLVFQGGVGAVSEDQPSRQVVLRWEVHNAGPAVSMPSTHAEQPSKGGGIFNSGALTLENSTISGNVAQGGGGIEAWVSPTATGTATVRNSEVSQIQVNGHYRFYSYSNGAIAVDEPFAWHSQIWHSGGQSFYLPIDHGQVITTTTILDSVITEYPAEMMYSSANTLMSQVVRDVPPTANYFATLAAYAPDSERRRLMQPIMTGVQPAQAGAGTTLSDLATFFRRDKPINVVAELDATTFQKEPAEVQRIPFDSRVPIHFEWNIKPLEEREQDLTVKLFLEGIPLNGTEPTRIPIYTNTVHTYVGVRMFAYGTPIALYATLYASLTFALGGLATWAVPRAYAGVVALYSRRQQRKKAARRATGQLAVAARRYSRKTPGRRS